MAIEFSCPKCEHLLRTGNDKAGLSAKCPACGEIIWVPYGSTDMPAPPPATPDAGQPAEELSADTTGADQGFALASEPSAPPEIPVHEEAGAVAAPEVIPRRRSGAEVYCPGCHATNDASARNCRFCGASLEGAAPIADEPPTIPPFDVSEVMNTSWKLYTQELGLMLGAAVVMNILQTLAVVPFVVSVIGVAIMAEEHPESLLILIPVGLLLLVLLMFGVAILRLGNTKLYFNIVRGDGATFGNLFWGFTAEGRPLIMPSVLVNFVVGALVVVGGILCCAPGLLVLLCSWPAMLLLVDKQLTGSDAIGQTIEMSKRDIGSILAIGAMSVGIVMVPGFVPYIGFILQLFAIPLGLTLGYLRMTRQATQFERWKAPASQAAV